MKDQILAILEESVSVKERSVRKNMDTLVRAAEAMAGCVTASHKILIFGNGGSAADAQHIAAEFVNRFQIERPPLGAIALTTDTSVITSIGNDYSFDDIFEKQIAAFGQSGDIAWGISTSGNSKNVVKAMETARAKGLFTIGMCGQGGKIESLSDLILTVDSKVTARIQETHIVYGHVLCHLVDKILFPDRF